MRLPFADRAEAGRELGRALLALELDRPIVLAVPRGGVAVAAPVAEELGGELDVVVVRKLGAPTHPELGIGAVGAWGEPWLDERLIDTLGVSRDQLEREIDAQRAEARRRVEAYRVRPESRARSRAATSSSSTTGSRPAARSSPPRTCCAPRARAGWSSPSRSRRPRASAARPPSTTRSSRSHTPEPFFAVGQWYRDFHQVSDDEVRALLAGGAAGPVGWRVARVRPSAVVTPGSGGALF